MLHFEDNVRADRTTADGEADRRRDCDRVEVLVYRCTESESRVMTRSSRLR
jgi:hypothetical protein